MCSRKFSIMSITVNNYSNLKNTRSNFGRNIDIAPKITINSKKMDSAIKWVHENIASQDQRLILGLTALGTQPVIDLKNKKVDEETMELLDKAAVTYQIVLTKTDKISTKSLNDTIKRTEEIIKKHGAAYVDVLATSSEKNRGLDELKAEINSLI